MILTAHGILRISPTSFGSGPRLPCGDGLMTQDGAVFERNIAHADHVGMMSSARRISATR